TDVAELLQSRQKLNIFLRFEQFIRGSCGRFFAAAGRGGEAAVSPRLSGGVRPRPTENGNTAAATGVRNKIKLPGRPAGRPYDWPGCIRQDMLFSAICRAGS